MGSTRCYWVRKFESGCASSSPQSPVQLHELGVDQLSAQYSAFSNYCNQQLFVILPIKLTYLKMCYFGSDVTTSDKMSYLQHITIWV